jgi:hypothetical protein
VGRTARIALLLALASAAPARALTPPMVRIDIIPGDAAGGLLFHEGPAGPLLDGASVTYPVTPPSLVIHNATARVDYGSAQLQSSTVLDASVVAASLCAPAPCGSAGGRWADRVTLHAPGLVADGTPGSFTARFATAGQLAATIPSWTFPSIVIASYGFGVTIDGTQRERLFASCIAVAGGPCSLAKNLTLYPSAGGNVAKPLPAAFGTFQLGPYDFVWGQPFDLEVLVAANTSANRQVNHTGFPSALSDVSAATWLGGLVLYPAPAGAGEFVALRRSMATVASGAAWFGLPEPEDAASSALLALALLARLRVRGQSA